MKHLLSVKEYILNYIVCNFLNLIFIRYIWFGKVPYYILLLPFSWVYDFVVYIIKFSYRCGLLKVYRFPLSVVVIGNLTVGGNGKTPMVLWLVQQLQNRRWCVGVVSRGYGGCARYYPIIINKYTSSYECGDEPLLIWQRTNVPIAVAPNRVDAVALLLQSYPLLDVIVADDGLQHYALARDIEWIVVHSEYRFGNGYCLPAGPMREKITRLNTVQQIIFCGSNKVAPGEISMQLIPVAVVNLLNGKRQSLDLCSNVVAMAGISHPSQFFSTLRIYGIVPIKEISFSDHQVYSKNILYELVNKNEMLLMTEKDAVKCRSFARNNWWYLEVEAQLSQKATRLLLRSIEDNILKYNNRRKYRSINYV